MKADWKLVAIGTLAILLGVPPVLALNPSLEVSQYAHTAWTVRDGFALGNIYAMAQTPDGYLWLGTEFGPVRFDGVRSIPLQPLAGQKLPDVNVNSLLVTRDGTLWIGTFAGLAGLSGGKLSQLQVSEVGDQFVSSLFEDSKGTVWIGTMGREGRFGRLYAMQGGRVQRYGEDVDFGRAVWAMYEDSSGNLWAAAQSGLWRIKPSPPKQYPTRTELIALNRTDDGRLLVARHEGGLLQFAGDKLESYPLRDAGHLNRPMSDPDVDANRVVRDRDGGLWIGTVQRGLIHVHQGRAEVFTKADGLSGDIVLSVFEDREGDVWVATTGGLDRFRELPVTTFAKKQGLSSDATTCLLAAADGSIWIAAAHGLTRWNNGQTTIFDKSSGLPDEAVQSLFQADDGRIWASTVHGLAYLKGDRFVTVDPLRSETGHWVSSITGDHAGNLWLSGMDALFHLRNERLVEQIAWAELGSRDLAWIVLADRQQGGVWLGFRGGDLSYFKDHQSRATYTKAEGLGAGVVAGLQLDREGALWIATNNGGLSRLIDGRITTLTTRNRLPCNGIHWSMEDNDGAFWLYTACGLLRITRSELNAWVADPNRRIQTTVWDAADGVRIRSGPATGSGPWVAKSTDGKLWFVTGEGVQVVDPHHLAQNKIPPPVYIEQLIADHKSYRHNLPGATVSRLRLPPLIRDLQIEFTGVSLAAPEKMHFKYKLEGQDSDWREVVNVRQAQYTNLPPANYRFRVIASNNSGVWNEQGDALEFSVAPAYYQTNWFRALCAAMVLVLVWAVHRFRTEQLRHQFNMTLEARVGERLRIARDLHDTLLQGAHGVLLRFQVVSGLLPEGSMAKEKLDAAIDQTAEFITEARDQVQDLRTSTVEGNDLAQSISALREGLPTGATGHRPSFNVAVGGESRNLHPIVRDETYKIVCEALRNAFQHAQAQRVEVEIHYNNDEFRVRVRDDGRGMDAAVLSRHGTDGHYGLPGMRERATVIGGKLTLWSAPIAGTEVELCVPARKAYCATEKDSWLTKILTKKVKA
jgi:signal transduction histidine kinase/ligand-binding sensor domain-containing protein